MICSAIFIRFYRRRSTRAAGWAGSSTGPKPGVARCRFFRRADCPYTSATLPLRGLEPDATYTVTSVDAADRPITLRGSDLMQHGLAVHIDTRPAAVIYTYVRR